MILRIAPPDRIVVIKHKFGWSLVQFFHSAGNQQARRDAQYPWSVNGRTDLGRHRTALEDEEHYNVTDYSTFLERRKWRHRH